MAKTVHVCVGGSGAYTLEEMLENRPDHRMVIVNEGFGLGPSGTFTNPQAWPRARPGGTIC